MPKPTLMQAVLRKPTRSYADPRAASPWAEQADEDYDYHHFPTPASRYASQYQGAERRSASGVAGLGARDDLPHAGPSQPRRVKSTVSMSSDVIETSSNSRFPKPARRVASSVAIREGAIVRMAGDGVADEDGASMSRSTTVRRKKKSGSTSTSGNRSRAGSTGAVSVATARPPSPSTVTSRRDEQRVGGQRTDADTESIGSSSRMSSRMSSYSTSQPPSLRPRKGLYHSGSSSSADSSSLRPLSPLVQVSPPDPPMLPSIRPEDVKSRQRPTPSVIQKSVINGVAPLTPPSSIMSSTRSSLASREASMDSALRVSPTRLVPATVPVMINRPEIGRAEMPGHFQASRDDETDDEEDVFYTPRGSLESLIAPIIDEPPVIVTPIQEMPPPPLFNLLPPTPAAVEDEGTPFHSEPTSPILDSLHPDRLPTQFLIRSLTDTTPMIAVPLPQPLPPPVPVKAHEDDAHSAASDVGTDEDEESERKGILASSISGFQSGTTTLTSPASQARGSRPPSVIKSTPASSVDGRPGAMSRQSTSRRSPRRSFDEFVVNRRNSMPLSEASFGARSAREGSVRSGISGYGKGGWAAAAAVGEERSRTSSPVMMYNPAAAHDGWAHFQPPPRQSKFTALPPASQPLTFDRLLRGESAAGSIRSASQNVPPSTSASDGGLQIPIATRSSSPSIYSQLSDEDEDLPRPSRSYASRAPTDGQTTSSVISADFELPQRFWGNHEVPAARRLSSTSSAPPVPPPKNPSRRFSENVQRPGGARSYARSSEASMSAAPTRSNSLYMRNNSPMRISPDYPTYSNTYQPRPAWQSPSAMVPGSAPVSRPTTPAAQSVRGFDPPSFLDPDTLTVLPEMTPEDSARTYRPEPSESGRSRRTSGPEGVRRSASVWDARGRYSRSEIGGVDRDEDEDFLDELPRRAKSAMGHRGPESMHGGSSYGEGVLMQSDGVGESVTGYTNMVLPAGAYTPVHPSKSPKELNSRILGLPHAAMASITLSTSAHRLPMTPSHLRKHLPPPVDFSSHLKPPGKVGSGQCLVQVYAVGLDEMDVLSLEDKTKADVGKWVPGRSFVGRCVTAGAEEKDLVRGDLVMGLLDIRRSGALSEFILVDRRRLARAPHPTTLSLEQLSLLPLYGIPAIRALRTPLNRFARALIMDAHTGVSALVCQTLSKSGVHVTALIGGGDGSVEAHESCMANGARGVLTGNPAAVMLSLEEDGWDFVLDTVGGQRVYDAAKRMLKDGARLVSLQAPDSSLPLDIRAAAKPSGLKTLRAAFSSRRKTSKFIAFQHLPPAGSGEPEVDSSGMDCRDVLEDPGMAKFRPVVRETVPFERGAEAFREPEETVVRLIN